MVNQRSSSKPTTPSIQINVRETRNVSMVQVGSIDELMRIIQEANLTHSVEPAILMGDQQRLVSFKLC